MEATSYTDFHRYSSMISPYVQIIEIRIRTRAFDGQEFELNEPLESKYIRFESVKVREEK